MYDVGDMVEIKFTGFENEPVYFLVLDRYQAGEKYCYKCYNVKHGNTLTTYLPRDKTRKV